MTEPASQPAAPAASTILNPGPPIPIENMTPAQAMARHQQIMSDPDMTEWRESWRNGDLAKRDEFAQLHAVMSRPDPDKPAVANVSAAAAAEIALHREQVIDHLRSTADIPEPVADMIRKDMPVTAHERRMAEQERGRMLADPDFVKSWLSGKRDARSRMALVDVILARPVIRQ
jgi:hypothetical protein